MATAQDWDPEAEHERKKEQTEEATAMQTGAAQARDLVNQELHRTKQFVEEVTGADLDRDLPDDDPHQHNLEQLLGGQLSKQLALGYISREAYEREREKDKGRKLLLKQQFRGNTGGHGSKCTGRTRERMTGGRGDGRQPLTEDLDAQLDAAYEVKDAMRSGSINGQRSKSVTEAHVVTRNESQRESDDSQGIIGRTTSRLFGR